MSYQKILQEPEVLAGAAKTSSLGGQGERMGICHLRVTAHEEQAAFVAHHLTAVKKRLAELEA